MMKKILKLLLGAVMFWGISSAMDVVVYDYNAYPEKFCKNPLEAALRCVRIQNSLSKRQFKKFISAFTKGASE